MAQSAQINKMNFSHDAIIDWLLANPDKNYGDCATAFGYTRSWLSTVITSDVFRVEYKRRREQVNVRLAEGIQDKMAHVAKKSLDKLEEILEKDIDELDPRLVLDIGDKMLHRQGYAPSKGGGSSVVFNQQNNYSTPPNAVDKETLTNARDKMRLVNGMVQANALPDKSAEQRIVLGGMVFSPADVVEAESNEIRSEARGAEI